MAASNTFQCSVITPERKVLECEATSVAIPAHDGEIGILWQRAPLVCKLGIGALRVESGGETHVLFIDRGFAQVVDNRVSILTQRACKPEEIDAAAAKEALTEALKLEITDEASFVARSDAIQRAKTQLKLAR